MTLSRMGVFGMPWHGLVREDVLALPNGSTMDLPPSWLNDHRYGDTILVQPPWAPGADRSADEQVADIAAGRQWERYALLGGGRFSLLGRDLRSSGTSRIVWLYAAPNKFMYSVSFPRLSGNVQSWNRSSITPTLQVTRFGRIPARPEPVINYGLGNQPVGQETPHFAVADTGTVYVDLMDATPDGAKVILAVYHQPAGEVSRPRLMYPVAAVGFWMVTVSGTPGIDFTAEFHELKSRRATIGDLTVADDPVVGPLTDYHHHATRVDTDTWMHTYEPYDRGHVYTPLTRINLQDQIVAMWFDESGNPHPVTLNTHFERTVTYTESDVEMSGSPTYSERPQNQWQMSAPVSISSTREQTTAESLTVTLAYRGASTTWASAGAGTRTWLRNSSIRHLAGGSGIDSGARSDESVFTWTGPDGARDFLPGFSGLRTERDALVSWPPKSIPGSVSPTLVRYSNNAIALISTGHYPEGPYKHWPCLTPQGVKGATTEYPVGHQFGTFNPATGELLRGQNSQVRWA